jgi:DnaJ-class molecular chaperone
MAAERTIPDILKDMVPCPVCHATGVDPASIELGVPERCKPCGGVGFIKPPPTKASYGEGSTSQGN